MKPAPGLEVVPHEKRALLPRPVPRERPSHSPNTLPRTQLSKGIAEKPDTGFLLWSGPGVAVMFDAAAIEKDGDQLVLRTGDGEEIARLGLSHVVRWADLTT
ncbi:hypothetical protein [Kribbella ginsengisoli]